MEYMMYQEIPYNENGAINELKGATLVQFYDIVSLKIAEEHANLDEFTTPRITYIMYEDDYPIGEVAIRTKLNEFYKKNSGNIGYKIRPSKRNLGYGNLILKLALEKCKEFKMKDIFLQSYDYNEASKKVILNNGGILVDKDNNIEIYKIVLKEER